MDGRQSELKISVPKKNSESKQMDGLSSENGEAIAPLPETLSTESNLENHLEKSGRFSGFKGNLRRHLSRVSYLKYHYQQRLVSRLANAKNSTLRSKTVECNQPSPYLLNFPTKPTPEQLAEAEEAVRQRILLSSSLHCGQLIPRQADLEEHRDEDPAYAEVDMVEPNNTPASSSLTESMNEECCDQSLPNPGQGSWDIVHIMSKFKISRH